MPWQINRKDASGPRHIADTQNAFIRSDAAPTDRQTEAEARLISTSLDKWQKQLRSEPRRKTSTVVAYIDQNAIGCRVGIQ